VRIRDFDFELPPGRIAQRPATSRDASLLMVLDRESGATRHRSFRDLPGLLRAGDLVVLNDTRVFPARLPGRKATGGRVELLLLEPVAADPGCPRWRCWLQASRKPAPGSTLLFDQGLRGRVLARDGEVWTVELECGGIGLDRALEEAGRVPLPPYIERPEGQPAPVGDRVRYQTVYARRDGAVAAPTAGLHFTESVLSELAAKGIELAYLTLHVGPGTFQPVRVEHVEEHRMHGERYDLPERTAAAVDRVRKRGGRVVAVGTTVVRTLEFRGRPSGTVEPGRGVCDLFIYPGHRFRIVDVMLTNFHLPGSTLILLVSAFAGRESILSAYREAISHGYRFYSYGDAMLIGPTA
jgi:S-adenosylmethionine:tRNA ribosyltransferase-isomerase